MKKFLMIIAAFVLSAVAVHAEVDIKLIVDDKVIDTEYVSINDRTLIPLRAMMESTGAEVKWNDADQSIDVTKGEKNVHLQIDSNVLTVNGVAETMDVSPILHNGDTTYVPLRAICESFDFKVDWDEGTKTILVNDPDGCAYLNPTGFTVKEYLIAYGLTVQSFELKTGLKYEDYKDKPMALAENDMSLKHRAINFGVEFEVLEAALQIDAEETTTWGEALGEAPLGAIIQVIYGQKYSAQMFLSMCEYYGFGEEYTPYTKYKYTRTIMDRADVEVYPPNAPTGPSEDQEMEYAKLLPTLTKNKKRFTITLESGKVIKGEVYPDLAPETVANFIKLVEDGFYDGLIFHRVIDDFMIQGGGYDTNLTEKKSESIHGEFYFNGVVNPLKHERGVISMARTDDMNSASSQFFITDETVPFLDGAYAAFGKITKGLDVVDEIAKSTTETIKGMENVPTDPIVIKSITIDN